MDSGKQLLLYKVVLDRVYSMFTKRFGSAKKRENLLGRGLTKRKAAYSTKSDCNRASVAMTCKKSVRKSALQK